MSKISLIFLCYNEDESLPLLYTEIEKLAKEMPEQVFEFIFVNDGSKDNTLKVIKELKEKDPRVRFISFSRNFGKESGIYAGLQIATGDFVALLDADLQHPPQLIKEMYSILANDNDIDCVATRRISRTGEPALRSFFSRNFYRLINKISDTPIVEGACDFRLMRRPVVDAILELKEYNRFSKGIFGWVGFNIHWLPFENVERVAGHTKWSFVQLLLYSFEGIIAFSTRPLMIASFMGILFCLIAIILMCVYAFKTVVWGEAVPGFPTLICVIFLIGGIQLFCLGILGQYLSKAYLEAKKRPLYIIKEKG